MYEGAATSVRSIGEMSNEFPVSVGLHQGSNLSPYLFALNVVIGEDVDHMIKTSWTKWMMMLGVLCDRRMHVRLKGKCYKTIVRLAMLYGSECWATTGQHIHKMAAAEMHMTLIRKCLDWQVSGRCRRRGRLLKTWIKTVWEDIFELGVGKGLWKD
ncbi:hypothetical protein UlMin_043168 [Ulmus minor]